MKILSLLFVLFSLHYSSGGMTGGWSPADVNSTDIQKYAAFAVEKISLHQNSLYRNKLIEVLSAEKQVVSGMNYKMNIRMGPTECKKNENTNVEIDECAFLSCMAAENCTVVVWDQRWKDSTKLIKHSCQREPKPC